MSSTALIICHGALSRSSFNLSTSDDLWFLTEIILGFGLLLITENTAYIRSRSEISRSIEPAIVWLVCKLGLTIIRSINDLEFSVTLVGCLITFQYLKLLSILCNFLPAWDSSWSLSLGILELKSPSNITFFLLTQTLLNKLYKASKTVVELGGRYRQPREVDWERIVTFNQTASRPRSMFHLESSYTLKLSW